MAYAYGQTPNKTLNYIDASGISDVDQELLSKNNLSDVDNTAQARLNLGIVSGSGTGSGTGWDITVAGNYDDLVSTYPATSFADSVAFVKQKKTTLFGLLTTKQDGLYISDGSSWNKTNLQVQFFDDSLEFRDDVDNSKTMKFQLSDISPSGTIILNAPNASGTIATVENLASHTSSSGIHFEQEEIDHSSITNLEWSKSGHSIDSNVDFNNNSATNLETTSYNVNYMETGSEAVGTSYWCSGDLTFSDVLENGVVGQRYLESFMTGQNDTGSEITNGTPIEYANSIGNSGNYRITPAIVTSSKPVHYYIGIATETIGNGSSGKITTHGKVRGIQTNGAN